MRRAIGNRITALQIKASQQRSGAKCSSSIMTSLLTTSSAQSSSSSSPSSAAPKHGRVVASLAGPTGGTGIVILDRPKHLNALSLEMIDELNSIAGGWMNQQGGGGGPSCMIMKGTGPKAFCAGGDVKRLADEAKRFAEVKKEKEKSGQHAAGGGELFVPGRPGTQLADFFRREYLTDHAIAALSSSGKLSQVSLWDGVVMGGGVGVSIFGTYRVATENTLFAMPETGIGLFPDVGASYFCSRLPGGLGAYIALTGCRMRAAELLYTGLATHFVPSEKMKDLEEHIISEDGQDVIGILRSYDQAVDVNQCELAKQRGAIDACFSAGGDNYRTGRGLDMEQVMAWLQAKGGNSSGEGDAEENWANRTHGVLSKMCPTSLKVTARQIHEGRGKKTLLDCYRMEFRLSQRAMDGTEFIEGVRAQLVDKDQSPQWRPHVLSDVTDRCIDGYFASLGDYELDSPHVGTMTSSSKQSNL